MTRPVDIETGLEPPPAWLGWGVLILFALLIAAPFIWWWCL